MCKLLFAQPYYGTDPWWEGPKELYRDQRSLEQRLADERRAYAREQEQRGRQVRDQAIEEWVFANWAQVRKECGE
ncbi:MAG: hypothetical protein HC794_01825 [Nitrospiraceae bacterium]|nr:hypothetical protein [Nitrospiraceae bacterium]